MARNKTRETKIRKMIEMGLSVSQIAGALHIKKAVIAGIIAETGKSNAGGNAGNPIAGNPIAGNPIAGELREGKKDVQSSKTTKIKKDAGKSEGDEAPDNIESERGERSSVDQHGNLPEGSGEGIKFIGGKKHMGKKGENQDQAPEEFEYECPHCHHEFNEKSDTCPSCGGSLSGYDD